MLTATRTAELRSAETVLTATRTAELGSSEAGLTALMATELGTVAENAIDEERKRTIFFTNRIGERFLFFVVEEPVGVLIEFLQKSVDFFNNERVVVVDEIGLFTLSELEFRTRNSAEFFHGEEAVAVLIGRFHLFFASVGHSLREFGEIKFAVLKRFAKVWRLRSSKPGSSEKALPVLLRTKAGSPETTRTVPAVAAIDVHGRTRFLNGEKTVVVLVRRFEGFLSFVGKAVACQ